MRQAMRTADVAGCDRFDLWQHLMAQEAMPVLARTEHRTDFTAAVATASFGTLRTIALEHPPLEIERTPALIRQSDPQEYQLALNLGGHQRVDQDRNSALLRPGDMVLYHSSHPFHTHVYPGGERERAIVTVIPQGLLPTPDDRLRRVLAVPFAGDEGLGPLVSSYLHALGRERPSVGPHETERLATVTLDLISLMLARHLDTESALPPETRASALFARIQSFILGQLGDPTLTPEAIAAAHHISARSLHRLFQANGATVAGWIRQRRLDRCRRDLTDPLLQQHSVIGIARRSGFTDAAHFSRVFTATFGVTPTAWRQQPSTMDSPTGGGHRQPGWRAPSTTWIPDRRDTGVAADAGDPRQHGGR